MFPRLPGNCHLNILQHCIIRLRPLLVVDVEFAPAQVAERCLLCTQKILPGPLQSVVAWQCGSLPDAFRCTRQPAREVTKG